MSIIPITIFGNQLTGAEISFVQNLSGLSYVTGDVLYYNGTNLTRLGIGTDGQVLTVNDAATAPQWEAAGSSGANTALSNLASVAINTALILGTSDAAALGSATKMWSDLFLASGAVINFNNGNMTITHAAASLTVAGGPLIVPTNGLTINATNVTSTGTQLNYLNAATGTTGTTSTNVVFSTSPALTTPNIGAATAASINGLTITSSTGTLTIANGKTLTVSNSGTLAGGDAFVLAIAAGKTLTVSNSITVAGTDSTVMTFPTTTATIARTDAGQTFTGVQVMTSPTITTANLSGAQLLAENASIALDPSLSADGKYSGTTISGTAGATLAFGDVIYLAAADSRWELTDASAAATAGSVLVGICVLAAAADGDPTVILLSGNIRADAVFPTFTISAPVYISETAGDVTGTQPVTADAVIRVLGFALTADSMYFNPSGDYITHI